MSDLDDIVFDVLRTFKTNKDTHKEYKSIILAKNTTVSADLTQYMEKIIMSNNDNKTTLDNFTENPEYRKAPPFPFQSGNIDRTKWVNHLLYFKKDEEYLKQLEYDHQTLGALIRKIKQYGTVNVHD